MNSDLCRDKVVLVTGGTRGIGLATARVFASHGADTVLTYRWGTADDDELRASFVADGFREPLVVQADVSLAEDTDALIDAIAARYGRVDTFISNASVSLLVKNLDDYTERGFMKSIRASAWPTFEYVTKLRTRFGSAPRHVLVMSSDGPDRWTPSYDFVAASKAVVETLTRYMAYRLKDEGTHFNVLRSRAIKTESFDATFGDDFFGFLRTFVPEQWFMEANEVAEAAFAICSGMFDGMTGQVVTVDRGNTFGDGISYLFERRAELDL